MKSFAVRGAAAAALVVAVAAGCGGDDNRNRAEVRVIHAASDAPAVNARLDGGNRVEDLAFADASAFQSVRAGSYDVTVEGILPDGSTTPVIDAPGVALDRDEQVSILAIGSVADATIEPLVVRADDAATGVADVRVQVVHASDLAAPAGTLDVYVTDPGTELADATPVGRFDYRGSIGPATVAAGDYRIRVTPQGQPGQVVFDSGTVALEGGSDLLIAAIDNLGPRNGPRQSPVRLLVAPAVGDPAVLVDQDAGAALRAAHLSADAGDVDVSIDGVNAGNPVVTGLAFDNADFADNFTDFLDVPVGAQTVNVEQSGAVVVSASPTLERGERYTGYALGLASPGMAYQALALEAAVEDQRSVATEARVRIVHAATQVPTAEGQVDVYLLADQSATVADLGDANRLLDDVPFGAITDYLSVTPGDANTYRLFITAFDDPTTAPVIADLPALVAGGVYTVVALDQAGATGVAAEPGIRVDQAP